MLVEYQGSQLQMPDFFIAGAPKSGTTSIFYYLKSQPEIFFPELKEPHFFTFFGKNTNFQSPDALEEHISDLREYAAQYEEIDASRIMGDASQSYLYGHDAVIRNVREIYGDKGRDVKVLVFLRNPIDRAWSQYWHFRKSYLEDLSFEESITDSKIEDRVLKNNWNIFYDYIGFGRYSEQIKAYKAYFKEVKVILFDDILKDKNGVIEECMSFLGLEYDPEHQAASERVFNQSGTPKKSLMGWIWVLNKRFKVFEFFKKYLLTKKQKKKINYYLMERALEKQKMPPEIREKLRRVYAREISDLENLLGRQEIRNWI